MVNDCVDHILCLFDKNKKYFKWMLNIMSDLLTYKITYIYIFFQIFSVFLLFDSFFSYLILFNLGVYFGLLTYIENSKIQAFFIFCFLLCIFIYSFFSLVLKNPNNYLNDNALLKGYYFIEKKRNKTRQMGSLTGRGSLIEPSSYGSLNLKNKQNNSSIKIECSIMEHSCPFYKNINEEVYVEYIVSDFFQRKYAFYLSKNGEIYDKIFFKEEYRKENNLKILFIIFYLGGNLIYILLVIKYIKSERMS